MIDDPTLLDRGTAGAPPVEAADGGPQRWEAVADEAWWAGLLDECIAARERAYAEFEARGDRRAAGRAATWLFEHYRFRAQPARAGGWLRRARRMLGDDTDSLEHGYLLLREAEQAHGEGDLDAADAAAIAAVEAGRRLRSPNLEADALQARGRILLAVGRARDGMGHLDEAMLLAVEGRLDPYTTGKVFCSLVSACDELGDLRRAAEWTDAVAEWASTHPGSVFPGLCRVHRAGLLLWRGEWAIAEAEAKKACEELAQINIPNAAAGFLKIAEVRRQLGDHAGAEAAFQRAEELNGQAWAGLALLRLAEGRTSRAVGVVTRALDEAGSRLARGKLLPAYVEVMVAAGDLTAAGAATDELEAVAAEYESPVLIAAAATARGRVQLAAGDHAGACVSFHEALERWTALEAPYEVATTRMLMGQACVAAGDQDGAERSFHAAESIFERLGATVVVRRAGVEAQPAPGGLTGREVEVLRLVAAGRTNRQIAEALHISDKTVGRHVSNIFTKIGVGSRAAATAYAFEHGVVG